MSLRTKDSQNNNIYNVNLCSCRTLVARQNIVTPRLVSIEAKVTTLQTETTKTQSMAVEMLNCEFANIDTLSINNINIPLVKTAISILPSGLTGPFYVYRQLSFVTVSGLIQNASGSSINNNTVLVTIASTDSPTTVV